MDEIINPDEHTAEVSALRHEIYRLEKELENKTNENLRNITTNKDDPFRNPSDFKNDYGGSYSDIQPRLGDIGYVLPYEPDKAEHKKLRKHYSIGGWCLLIQFTVSLVMSVVLMLGIQIIVSLFNPDKDGDIIYSYIYGSSILIGINMIVYIVCNVANTFIGMKWAGFKASSLFQTKNFKLGGAVQYCLIGLFLWTASIYAGSFVETILNQFGMTCLTDQEGLGESPLGIAVGTLYTCIIAPVTEEMLFRGMLLKVFSKADRRFAIFATAIFFGLAHGNIPQFILAFLLGIFMAHITLRHNSIVPSIIVHIFINTFSTVFGSFADKGETAELIATMILIALSLIGAVMLIVFRTDGNILPMSSPHQRKRGIMTAKTSVPVCLAFIVNIIYMIINISSI